MASHVDGNSTTEISVGDCVVMKIKSDRHAGQLFTVNITSFAVNFVPSCQYTSSLSFAIYVVSSIFENSFVSKFFILKSGVISSKD